MRKGVKKRQEETDIDPENPEEIETCILTEDKRCRSLENLQHHDEERKEMRKIVRMNSIRKTKSVDDILREQLDEVTEVMQQNIIKLRDRHGSLDDLLDKANILTGSAVEFKIVSKKVKQKEKLRMWKYRILAGVAVAVVCVVLLVVVLAVVFTQQDDKSPPPNIVLISNLSRISGSL
ncbi:vesicle-associated membrane protein 5-like isoform X2 [Saccostrea cucullata]